MHASTSGKSAPRITPSRLRTQLALAVEFLESKHAEAVANSERAQADDDFAQRQFWVGRQQGFDLALLELRHALGEVAA